MKRNYPDHQRPPNWNKQKKYSSNWNKNENQNYKRNHSAPTSRITSNNYNSQGINRSKNMKFEFSEEREKKIENLKPLDPTAFPNFLTKEEIIDELLQFSKFTNSQLQKVVTKKQYFFSFIRPEI